MNQVIETDEPDSAPEFVRNRIKMQEGYLREIGETFDGMVRAVVPLFDSDIRGVPMLQRASQILFA